MAALHSSSVVVTHCRGSRNQTHELKRKRIWEQQVVEVRSPLEHVTNRLRVVHLSNTDTFQYIQEGQKFPCVRKVGMSNGDLPLHLRIFPSRARNSPPAIIDAKCEDKVSLTKLFGN